MPCSSEMFRNQDAGRDFSFELPRDICKTVTAKPPEPAQVQLQSAIVRMAAIAVRGWLTLHEHGLLNRQSKEEVMPRPCGRVRARPSTRPRGSRDAPRNCSAWHQADMSGETRQVNVVAPSAP